MCCFTLVGLDPCSELKTALEPHGDRRQDKHFNSFRIGGRGWDNTGGGIVVVSVGVP